MTEVFTLQQLIYTSVRTAIGLVEQLTGIKTTIFSSPELAIQAVEARRSRKKDAWNLETWSEKNVNKTDGTPSQIAIKAWEVTTINSRIVLIIAKNEVDANPFEW